MQVTTDAVQIFGGYGCTKDYPSERWMPDSKILQVFDGANEIQRIILTRQLSK
jgi:alkylation response protein AidB-like acyl-CoA dehydrogenase